MNEGPKKVLVVEDDQAMRYYWELALKRLAIKADFAERADVALALALQHEYAVILMDVKLPGMSGLEAAEKIREHERQTNAPPATIVAITGGAASEESCRQAGMNYYYRKPHLLEEVRAILEQAAPELFAAGDQTNT